MYSIMTTSGDIQYNVIEYIADTEADVATVPTKCAVGSVIFVISTQNLYMLNSNKEWVLI